MHSYFSPAEQFCVMALLDVHSLKDICIVLPFPHCFLRVGLLWPRLAFSRQGCSWVPDLPPSTSQVRGLQICVLLGIQQLPECCVNILVSYIPRLSRSSLMLPKLASNMRSFCSAFSVLGLQHALMRHHEQKESWGEKSSFSLYLHITVYHWKK